MEELKHIETEVNRLGNIETEVNRLGSIETEANRLGSIEAQVNRLGKQSQRNFLGATVVVLGMGILLREPLSDAFHKTCVDISNMHYNYKVAKNEKKMWKLKDKLKRLESQRLELQKPSASSSLE